MTKNQNDRSHVRIKLNARVFVEVSARTAEAEAVLLHCEVLDVSYGGFRVRIDSEVPVDAILPICAELPGVEEPFYLAAEVKWCRANEYGSPGFLAGFKLLNSAQTDIKSWRGLLEHV
jgi:hypothetical protein